MKNQRIIGITGAFGSGKSTAANYFESKGYRKIYLSSYLEGEARKRDLPLTRKVLQDLGNEFREKHGNGILAKMALKDLKNEKKIVIDGLRNLGEIEELKKNRNGIVLGIVADRDVPFDRLKNLKRREKLDEELFYKLDLRDLGIGKKITGLQTAFCISLADVYIDSNSGLEIFYEKLDKFLEEYEK